MSTEAILLPYQQAWIADHSAVKVYEKSRRIGISWAEAADAALTAAAANGSDTWYIGYNQDMAQEFIRDCGFWARQYQLAAEDMEEIVLRDEDKDILAYRIHFASDHRITALSSRPSNLRGKQGRVVIDEAAFHDDLPELRKAAIALLMWGGQICIISTHNGDDNPFNEMLADIRAGKLPYSLHRTTLDQALEAGLYQRICLHLQQPWSAEAETTWRQELIDFYGDAADEELFCIPRGGGGTFLPRLLIERAMRPELPVLRLRLPEIFATLPDAVRAAEVRDWCLTHLAPRLATLPPQRHYLGEDFGRTGDLTVLAPITEAQTLHLHVPFFVELRNVPFREQEQILFALIDGLPRFMGGALDARGNGQYLAERAMQRYGPGRMAQVMLTEAWYREHMPRVKAAFEDGTLSLPQDADVLADLRALEMVKGVARLPEQKRTKGADGGMRHGDAAIALALGLFAVQTLEGGDIAYTSTGILRASAGRSMEHFMGMGV